MENCTIIKVKRKINEDPVDCLIIECKKKKLGDIGLSAAAAAASSTTAADGIDSIKEILKYAGSATSEAEIPAKLIEINANEVRKSTKPPILKQQPSKGKAGATVAKAKENEPASKPHTYVLTNKKRGFEGSSSTEAKVQDAQPQESQAIATDESGKPVDISKKPRKNSTFFDHVNIIDVIPSDYLDNEEIEAQKSAPSQITCNDVVLIREKVTTKDTIKKPVLDTASNEYVYDIYYTKNSNINLDLLYANNYEITPMINKDQLIILDENGDDNDGENYEDDEDSNDEANWRNDYPDEDDKESYNDDDDEDDYGDDYNEYGQGYYDEEGDGKLSSYLKKSCALDRSYHDEEDSEYDEYDERDTAPMSYTAYKKKLLRELEHDYQAMH